MPFDATQTKETMRDFARQVFVGAGQTANVGSEDIEAAVTSIVSFIEDNMAAINNVLPEPFKSTATTAQKRHLVGLVAAKLAGIL